MTLARMSLKDQVYIVTSGEMMATLPGPSTLGTASLPRAST